MMPLMALGMGLPMYVVVGSSLLAIFFQYRHADLCNTIDLVTLIYCFS